MSGLMVMFSFFAAKSPDISNMYVLRRKVGEQIGQRLMSTSVAGKSAICRASLFVSAVLCAYVTGCGGPGITVSDVTWKQAEAECSVSFEVHNGGKKPASCTVAIKPYESAPDSLMIVHLGRKDVPLELGPGESRVVAETVPIQTVPGVRIVVKGVLVEPM